jgi:hypothetical protein
VYWYAYCLWCGVQHVHTIMHILQKHVWFSLPNELPLRWSIDELGIPCARWTQWNDKEIHYDFPVEHWPMDIEGFRARLPGVLQLHQGSSVCIWTTPFFATLWVWDLISMGESSSASSSQTPRRNHAFVRVVHIWDHRRVVFNRGMGILSPSPVKGSSSCLWWQVQLTRRSPCLSLPFQDIGDHLFIHFWLETMQPINCQLTINTPNTPNKMVKACKTPFYG